VPRLWQQTIQAHRREVREAILDTAATLVAQHGVRAVTMSQIADETGIGRATLYKYFPSVEAILLAWHEQRVAEHLQLLSEVRDQAGEAGARLHAVLETYALIQHERAGHHMSELGALVHRDDTVARAQEQVGTLFRELLAEAAPELDLDAIFDPGAFVRHAEEIVGRLDALERAAARA
jgi:AcrR family transcriptional regulator